MLFYLTTDQRNRDQSVLMSKVLQLTFMYHERFKTTSSNMFFSSVKLILCSLVLVHCSTESVGCHEISFTYNHPSLSLPSCEKQQNQKSLRDQIRTYTHMHTHTYMHTLYAIQLHSSGQQPFLSSFAFSSAFNSMSFLC